MESGLLQRLLARRIRLPRSRPLVNDLLYFARRVPSQALARDCNIRPIVLLRAETQPRIGWLAIMMRAFSLTTARHPELRRCHMSWPWPHLYEHPADVGRFAVQRDFGGEQRLFFARIEESERLSLTELQRRISEFKTQPVHAVTMFRRQACAHRVPTLVRRLLWWIRLNISGDYRCRKAGTFGVTTVAAKNAVSIHPPSIGNIVLTYGPVDGDGNVRITFVYDHRVFDGGEIADALQTFEEALNNTVVAELRHPGDSGHSRLAA